MKDGDWFDPDFARFHFTIAWEPHRNLLGGKTGYLRAHPWAPPIRWADCTSPVPGSPMGGPGRVALFMAAVEELSRLAQVALAGRAIPALKDPAIVYELDPDGDIRCSISLRISSQIEALWDGLLDRFVNEDGWMLHPCLILIGFELWVSEAAGFMPLALAALGDPGIEDLVGAIQPRPTVYGLKSPSLSTVSTRLKEAVERSRREREGEDE